MKLIRKIGPARMVLSAILAFYILALEPWSGMDPSLSKTEVYLFYVFFSVFLAAYIVSWIRAVPAGILLLAWYLGMWVMAGLFEDDAGIYGIVAGLPVMVLGVFFIILGKREAGTRPSERTEWKMALNIFIAAVSILYLLMVVHNLFMDGDSTVHKEGILYLAALLLIYVIAVAVYRKRSLQAGILFMVWYAGVFALGIAFDELLLERSIGLSVLFLGVLVVFYDRVIAKRNPLDKELADPG